MWNWQQPDGPRFTWNRDRLARAEDRFLVGAGVLEGAAKHFGGQEAEELAVDEMSEEAVTTSEIEGEILDRASVQPSIGKQRGLATDRRGARPAERGIAELMVDL